MEDVLLSVHVLAGIVFVGGSAVAASLFPRYAPVAGAEAGERSRPVALAMHRITRVYGVLGLIVPAVGIVLATVQGRMAEVWIGVAMALTAIAGGLLALQIYPRQRVALAEPGNGGALRRLGMLAGIYNLLWAAVVVLMIIRPGDNHPS
jgi:Na+/proline symporter